MSSYGIIYGDQLWENNPVIKASDIIIMVEDPTLASRLPYHKFKLSYLYTIMRNYKDFLESIDKKVIYCTLDSNTSMSDVVSSTVSENSTIHIVTPHDKGFKETILQCFEYSDNIHWYDSPAFLTTSKQFKKWLDNKTKKRLLMADFYQWQRERLDVLMDGSDPLNDQWSYDEYNREKLKKDDEIPHREHTYTSAHWSEVVSFIQDKYSGNPGLIADSSWLPLNHDQARSYLDEFLDSYLYDFGTYEDAMTTRTDLVYHSGISALLNYGLLTPDYVIRQTLKHSADWDFTKPEHKRLLYSMEGFVRQIIGWREWIKGMYDTQYYEDAEKRNFFSANNELAKYFWDLSGDPDFENVPINHVIDKVNRMAYAHHIERLMILANWMTLNEYDPQECYNWFRCMFVDALDWVMVPNVYGMGLFADGGIFATKPYVASSNYIKKMSDYPKGQWENVWTDKFWNFLLKHEDYFKSNPRMNMIIQQKKKKLSK